MRLKNYGKCLPDSNLILLTPDFVEVDLIFEDDAKIIDQRGKKKFIFCQKFVGNDLIRIVTKVSDSEYYIKIACHLKFDHHDVIMR